MKNIYLCGHTGSINRGCEAIVRSTVDILKSCGANDVKLLTFKKQDDIKAGLDKSVELISYPTKKPIDRILSLAAKKLFKDGVFGAKFYHKNIIKNLDDNVILFNIGGDTYCYGSPNISYGLNDLAEKYNIPTVFWGCSVDDSALSNKRMIEDFNKYSNIVVRETLSKNIFEKTVDKTDKIFKTCDPAFHLSIEETTLPDNFIEKNTVGINISPMVFSDVNNANDIMYKNIYTLLEYIISKTDMNVCLIPHVYDIKSNIQDIKLLNEIYAKYKDTNRVGIVKENLSCTQLKYIISKCRFFIGARTHSTIAAYSSGVPCIALSYSVKSRGIAIDLFGTEEGYALPYKNITEQTEVKDAFINVLLNNEQRIIEVYKEKLPAYKQSIIDAAKEILKKM